MPNQVQVDDYPVTSFVKARLEQAEDAATAPDAAGYTVTQVTDSLHTFDAVGCTGLYRLTMEDGDGIEVLQGWVDVSSDADEVNIASASYHEILLRRLQEKLDTAVEDDGASGFQFTTLALENTRSVVGMAAADLDTQLNAIGTLATAAVNQTVASAIRAAIGMDAADLDALLATITTQTEASTIRAAIGIAAANLDTQLSALSDLGQASAIRAAIGLATANLDTRLAAIFEDTDDSIPSSIAAIRALLTDAQPVYTAPSVSPTGEISGPIIIGDDYLDEHSRAFEWTVTALSGVDVGDAQFWFGGENSAGDSWLVQGTVTDAGGGNWTVKAELQRTDTANLPEGKYEYSAELRDGSGNQVTRIRNQCGNKVELIEKQSGG